MVGQAKIDCLEGITPPPMGDVELSQVREITGYNHFTINGQINSFSNNIFSNYTMINWYSDNDTCSI